MSKILGLPKGSKLYFLKRDGTTKPFTILAVFEEWIEDFSKYRNSKTIEVAAYPDQRFKPADTERTMRRVSDIATHIAIVTAAGESQTYGIRNGDDWLPYYMDWSYSFFVRSTSDEFVLAENQ